MRSWIVERHEQSPSVLETDARHISNSLRSLYNNPTKEIQEHRPPTKSRWTTNLTKKLMVQPPYPPWRDKSSGEFITSIPTKLNISRFVVGFEIGITVGSMSIFNNTAVFRSVK